MTRSIGGAARRLKGYLVFSRASFKTALPPLREVGQNLHPRLVIPVMLELATSTLLDGNS